MRTRKLPGAPTTQPPAPQAQPGGAVQGATYSAPGAVQGAPYSAPGAVPNSSAPQSGAQPMQGSAGAMPPQPQQGGGVSLHRNP